MASVIVSQQHTPDGVASAQNFHCFPDLPPELRIRVWGMAYDAIPDILVYRFRLEVVYHRNGRFFDEEKEITQPQVFLIPLDEVKDLTRDLRRLRRVNAESRHESERLFDSYLRLNQTEDGDNLSSYYHINLPWKSCLNFFCLVGLTDPCLPCLNKANTILVAQIFETVRLLGFAIDWTHEFDHDIAESHVEFAELIARFHHLNQVALVSDVLMSEADLDGIEGDARSVFSLCSWSDWVGRVDENVINPHFESAETLTKDEHTLLLRQFESLMYHYGKDHPGTAVVFQEVLYGLIFRTTEDLDWLLYDTVSPGVF